MNPFKVDKIYCLCLDKRKALWQDLEKDCLGRGWTFEKFIAGDGTDPSLAYDHIDWGYDKFNPDFWGYGVPTGKINHFNAFLCHQQMIAKCKAEGIKNVLMLEDDSYITGRFDEIVKSINDAEDISESRYVLDDFDLLYLGWWQWEVDDVGKQAGRNLDIEDNWNRKKIWGVGRISQVGGLHGVIINESMYDIILGFNPVNPVDYQINQYGHSRLRSYFIYPKIIGLKSCFSETEKAFYQRDEL